MKGEVYVSLAVFNTDYKEVSDKFGDWLNCIVVEQCGETYTTHRNDRYLYFTDYITIEDDGNDSSIRIIFFNHKSLWHYLGKPKGSNGFVKVNIEHYEKWCMRNSINSFYTFVKECEVIEKLGVIKRVVGFFNDKKQEAYINVDIVMAYKTLKKSHNHYVFIEKDTINLEISKFNYEVTIGKLKGKIDDKKYIDKRIFDFALHSGINIEIIEKNKVTTTLSEPDSNIKIFSLAKW